jgi:hypothetical protein
VLFLWALFSPLRFNDTLALIFFCVAGFTDYLDGSISRQRGLITNFGILMDPLADKVLVCSAFIAFVESTHLNPGAPVKVAAWMVIIIVARELAITGLRLLAASKKIVLAADNSANSRPFRKSWPSMRCSSWTPANEWPSVVAKHFSAVGGRVRGNRAVGDGRADGGVGFDLSVAQPRDLFERCLKFQNRRGELCEPQTSSRKELGARGTRPSENSTM